MTIKVMIIKVIIMIKIMIIAITEKVLITTPLIVMRTEVIQCQKQYQ